MPGVLDGEVMRRGEGTDHVFSLCLVFLLLHSSERGVKRTGVSLTGQCVTWTASLTPSNMRIRVPAS